MKNPATGGGVLDSRSGEFDKTEFTLPTHNPQAAVRAIEAGLVSIAETDLPDFLRAEIDARDLSVVIRRRLTERQRLYVAIAFIWSLQIDTAEQLVEATLTDVYAVRHGPAEAEAERQRQRLIEHFGDPRRRARR